MIHTPRYKFGLLVVLTFALLGTGILAWRQHGEIRSLRLAGSADAALEAERRRAWEAEQRNLALEAELAALRGNIGNSDAEGQPTATASRDEATAIARAQQAESAARERAVLREEERRTALAALVQSPQYQRAVALEQQAEIEFEYSGLLRSLDLSDAQRQQLLALLVDRERIDNDIEAAAQLQGVSTRGDTLDSLIESARAEIDSGIRALIGDEAFASIQNYGRTMNQRADINQIQMAVTHVGEPLSSEQVSQLLTAYVQAPAVDGGPRRGGLEARVPGGQVSISAQMLGAARGVLSAAQIEALRQLQIQQRAGNAVEDMERQASGRD
jgi:hypothetical protein